MRSDFERDIFVDNGEIDPEQGYDDDQDSPAGVGPPPLSFPLAGSQDPRDLQRPSVVPIDQVQLPHWTEPASGTVPGYFAAEPAAEEDLSAWSSLGSQPVWRGDEQIVGPEDYQFAELADDSVRVGALAPEPAAEDEFAFAPYDDDAFYDEAIDDRSAGMTPDGGHAFAGAVSTGYERPKGPGRNMSLAVTMGAAMMALAIISLEAGPRYVVALAAAAAVLAANELYTTVRANTEIEPAWLVGVVAAGAMVVAAYNYGEGAIALVLFLTLAASLVWYLVGAASPESSVLRGSSATVLGVLYVGVLASYAGLMMGLPAVKGASHPGLTLFLGAVLCTVGYDVGGFFVGRRFGTRPLSAASPNKSVEGMLGGMVGAFLVGVIIVSQVSPFTVGEGALLGLAVFAAALGGDLCESLLKRDLGVKDMSSLLPGHGGLLDRFDGLLFALPIAYYVGRIFFF